MTYHGMLILRERLAKNWSQQGLCKGICTVSYLSKIEQGKTVPSAEILGLLLEKLGLHTDEGLEKQAEALAEQCREALFIGRPDRLRGLLPDPAPYRATAAGLELILLAQLARMDGQPLEPRLEGCMTPRQLALQRVLQGRQEEAVLLLPNAWTYTALGSKAYEAGSYTAALEHLQTGYDLAAREGAPHLMLLCKLFMGNSYCNCQDMTNMEKHYTVARRLASALGDGDALRSMDYNTYSLLMECGRYEEAYAYFSALEEPELMCLHKLAICCEKTGRAEEGLAALARADGMESEVPETVLARKLCALVRFRLERPNYLEKEGYGQLLQDCFDRCRRELPPGYAAFHLPWMVEWLTATRQYKKAFELMRDFPAKVY